MLSKEQICHEVNVVERIESYFRLYPVQTALNLLKEDKIKVDKEYEKAKKRESNSKYRNLHI